MHELKISVTISRTNIDNQFKGLITFKNKGEETSFNYLYTDSDGEQIDLEFSDKNGKFGVKGIPSAELFEKLNDNQKLIFAMSIEPLSLTISNTRSLSLSQQKEMDFTITVGEKEYLILFCN